MFGHCFKTPLKLFPSSLHTSDNVTETQKLFPTVHTFTVLNLQKLLKTSFIYRTHGLKFYCSEQNLCCLEFQQIYNFPSFKY